jgi:hypothetical protein
MIESALKDPSSDGMAWVAALRADGPAHSDPHVRLFELLLRAALFEMNRRQAILTQCRGESLDSLARSAAESSLVVALARLDDFRGVSRFTTWASKFALREARKTPLPQAQTGHTNPKGTATVDLTLTEGRHSMRAMAHDFAAHEIRPVAWEYDRDGTWPQEIIDKACELGLMNSQIPEAYGGPGATYLRRLPDRRGARLVLHGDRHHGRRERPRVRTAPSSAAARSSRPSISAGWSRSRSWPRSV